MVILQIIKTFLFNFLLFHCIIKMNSTSQHILEHSVPDFAFPIKLETSRFKTVNSSSNDLLLALLNSKEQISDTILGTDNFLASNGTEANILYTTETSITFNAFNNNTEEMINTNQDIILTNSLPTSSTNFPITNNTQEDYIYNSTRSTLVEESLSYSGTFNTYETNNITTSEFIKPTDASIRNRTINNDISINTTNWIEKNDTLTTDALLTADSYDTLSIFLAIIIPVLLIFIVILICLWVRQRKKSFQLRHNRKELYCIKLKGQQNNENGNDGLTENEITSAVL